VPAEHPEIRGALMQLAAVALERGDPKAALAQLRALGNYGDDERVHPFNRAAYWGNRAEARVRTGDVSGGLVDLERARELYATDGGHSTWMFLFMVHAARTLELAGKRKRSIHGYERALALAERVEVDPTELADAWFGLARALADRDPARARRLAEGARDRYAVLGAAGEAKLLEIETWLATVP
jgi:tetratricopeptide (TPR) repeat protein